MFEEQADDRPDKDEITREGCEGDQGSTEMRLDRIGEPRIFANKANADFLGSTESA